MVPEAEQPKVQVREPAAAVKNAPKRKAGVPVWRTGKPDAFLAAAVETARTAIEGITAAGTIGSHLAAKSEGDRLVTHLFESKLPGYVGWQWFAVLTRNSRSKVVTVSELGLLPSEDSILAPEWVPWAERVRPEDEQQQDEQQQDEEALQEAGGEDTAQEHAVQEDTAREDTARDDTVQDDTVQDDTVQDETVTGSDAADADFSEAAQDKPSGDDDGADRDSDVA
ncbi:DUF3027 domain-containing protein [Arthrobacter sp. AD-310]